MSKKNIFIHHLTQIASIALAYVWFGWHGAAVAFLINWAGNTHES